MVKLLDGDDGKLSPTLGLGVSIGFDFTAAQKGGPLILGARPFTLTQGAAIIAGGSGGGRAFQPPRGRDPRQEK